VAPSGISLVWSYRSVSTAPRRQRGPTRLPGRYRVSSSIFAKSEAFAQALSPLPALLRRFERYLDQVGCCDLGVLALPVVTGFHHDDGTEFGSGRCVVWPARCGVFLRYAHREGVLTPRPHQADRGAATLSMADIPRSIGGMPSEDARPGRATAQRRGAIACPLHGPCSAACDRAARIVLDARPGRAIFLDGIPADRPRDIRHPIIVAAPRSAW